MKALTYSTVIAAAVALAGCTVHQAQTPTLSGPSTLAFAPQISVVPDTVSQDGGSQAKVTVSIIGPDGRPVASQTFRVDMAINGVAQDFGTLSARTIVTNASGVATVTYTAPAPASGGAGSGNTPSACASGLPGNCVQIVATPTGPPAV